jgi:hypothetical protein
LGRACDGRRQVRGQDTILIIGNLGIIWD